MKILTPYWRPFAPPVEKIPILVDLNYLDGLQQHGLVERWQAFEQKFLQVES